MKSYLVSSLLVAALIAATVEIGTFAFFSDSERSINNIIYAGVIDLKVNEKNPLYGPLIDIKDIKPCHYKYQNITLRLVKESNPARAWIHFFNLTYHGGYEGLTPGFWKNHLDEWIGYSPDQTIGEIFSVPPELSNLSSKTLLEGLNFGGGSTVEDAAKILLRHTIAALLNAAHPNITYPLSENEIITQVNNALSSLDRDEMLSLKDVLDDYNNLGGDINNGDSCNLSEHIEIALKIINTSSGEEFIIISKNEHKTLAEIECQWINLTSDTGLQYLAPSITYILNVTIYLQDVEDEYKGCFVNFDIEFYVEQLGGPGPEG